MSGSYTNYLQLKGKLAILQEREILKSAALDCWEAVAETIRRAAGAGLVGCTIEDATGNPDHPLYDDHLAVERIAAGAPTAFAARLLKQPRSVAFWVRRHSSLFTAN